MTRSWWPVIPVLLTLACEWPHQPAPPPVPPPVPAPVAPEPETDESDMKGRYQIVHSQYLVILLDTVTGRTWKPCPRAGVPSKEPVMWCEMTWGSYVSDPSDPPGILPKKNVPR